MSETKDFEDTITPILEAGTWTNLGHTPSIVTPGKSGPNKRSIRANKNERVEVKNTSPGSNDPDLTFDGTTINNNLRGEISPVSTDKTDRNLMKTDIKAIIKASGIPFIYTIDDNPSKRNKDKSTFFMNIIGC